MQHYKLFIYLCDRCQNDLELNKPKFLLGHGRKLRPEPQLKSINKNFKKGENTFSILKTWIYLRFSSKNFFPPKFSWPNYVTGSSTALRSWAAASKQKCYYFNLSPIYSVAEVVFILGVQPMPFKYEQCAQKCRNLNLKMWIFKIKSPGLLRWCGLKLSYH